MNLKPPNGAVKSPSKDIDLLNTPWGMIIKMVGCSQRSNRSQKWFSKAAGQENKLTQKALE